MTRQVLETRLAIQVLVGDPTSDPAEIALLERMGHRSMLMVPVISRGATVGLLEVYSREERPWSRTDVNRARIISYPLGAALEVVLDERNSSSSELNADGRSSIGTWPVSGKHDLPRPRNRPLVGVGRLDGHDPVVLAPHDQGRAGDLADPVAEVVLHDRVGGVRGGGAARAAEKLRAQRRGKRSGYFTTGGAPRGAGGGGAPGSPLAPPGWSRRR